MSAERFNDDLRELVPGMRIRQAVTAARLNALTALARDANRGSMIRGGPGMMVSSGPQGVTVRARKPLPRAGGRRLPLEVLISEGEARVVASTVLGTVPTIGGTQIDAGTPPVLTVPESGTRYVVINCTLTPSVDEGFVFPTVVVSSITITLESTLPTAADLVTASGSFKVLLATYVDRVKTLQAGYGPITGELCDTLTSEGKATLSLNWAGYS
jgi:hypothetical protein